MNNKKNLIAKCPIRVKIIVVKIHKKNQPKILWPNQTHHNKNKKNKNKFNYRGLYGRVF